MFRRRLVIPTVIQTSPAESGAAALASVAGALGHHAPLSEVAALCAPTNRSCRIEDILHASEVLGLRAEARHLQHHDFGRLRRPALLDCGTGRFLVLAGRNLWPGRFRVMDPAEGMRTVDADELRRCCTGRVMELAPGESFRYQGRSRSLTGDILLRLPVMAPALVLAALAGLLLIVPGVAQPGFTKIFIDNILSPERRDWLRPLLLAMAVSLVIIWALGGLQRRVLLRQILKSGITGGAEFITRAMRLPFSFFTRFHGGEVAMRGQYIENVSQIIAEDLTATVTNLVAIALYALVMYLYDPALTILVSALILLNVLVMHWGLGKGRSLFTQFVAENVKVCAAGINGLQTIEVIKASGWEPEFFAHWAGLKTRAKNLAQRYSLWMLSLRQVPILLTDLSMAAVLGIGALRVMDGGMSIGMLAAFQVLLLAFIAPVQKLMTSMANLQSLAGQIRRIDDVITHPLDPQFSMPDMRRKEKNGADNGQTLLVPGVGVRLSGAFELKDVTFGYAPGHRPLIRDFSLRVAPGCRVALVGGSGSGKSTVVRLIAQLYRPWSGDILFDGVPRSDIPRLIFANSVAFVDQDVFLFEGSVQDNLTMWNPAIPERDVIQAAKDAEIHAEISSRPGAYHSKVLCGGANFSGGQRQRLEIARALAVNPSVLVLDEATSALDAETEERIDMSIRRRGMSCLIVAHRLSTIRDADEIVVMDRGAIVERGTHEDLMALDGQYARLLMV